MHRLMVIFSFRGKPLQQKYIQQQQRFGSAASTQVNDFYAH
jgi:hypothetical protein